MEKCWPIVEKRNPHRFAYVRTISYLEMGQSGRFPHPTAIAGKIVDISNRGMQIFLDGHTTLAGGTVIQAQVPLSDSPVTVPVLSEVKWVKEIAPGIWHAGLHFLLNGG